MCKYISRLTGKQTGNRGQEYYLTHIQYHTISRDTTVSQMNEAIRYYKSVTQDSILICYTKELVCF